jgi:hypothetical protein
VDTRNLVFNHLSVRIHDEDSNWRNHHNYMSGGSVGVEDKYASRDVSDGEMCAVYSRGFSSLDQCTVFVCISVE